jgi:Tol biopolymer transport system component/predicted Ser/Thr protein kinase
VIGATISHYRILEKLGEGGMGVVYKAHDTTLDRDVALKFLPSQFTASEEDRTRFVREAKAASSLDHPNICTVYEAGQSPEGQMFIAMAYYAGPSLKEVIANGRMSVEEALRIGIQVAEALKAADAKGIVHRDVKPGNIIITADGVAKLVDFGLASQAEWSKLTRSQSTLGTAAYMTPEQATGEGADHRSDLWSLGVILYEMIAGKLPFKGDHEAALMYSIVNEEPAPIQELVPDCSPDLVYVISRLLEKDPEDRYQSAAEVSSELRRLDRKSARFGITLPASVRWWRRKASVISMFVAGAALIALVLVMVMKRGPGGGSISNRYTLFEQGGLVGFGKWSPDGKSVAYMRCVRDSLYLLVRDVDSKTSRTICSWWAGWNSAENRALNWTASGEGFTYHTLSRHFLWISRYGGKPVVVAPSLLASGSVSPDSATLVMWTYEKLIGVGKSDSLSVIAVDLETKLAKRYQPDPFRQAVPWAPVRVRFSPDGSKIGLSMYDPGGCQLWILPWPDGSGAKPRRILKGATFKLPPDFDWHPDSRHVLYCNENSIWMVDTENEDMVRLTASTENEVFRSVSPDGKRILLDKTSTEYDIVELPLDGSPLRKLISTTEDEYSAELSADGKVMTYITERSGRPEIWVEEEGASRPIITPDDLGAPDSGRFWRASISPDGKRVAYDWAGTSSQRRLYVSSIEGGKPLALTPEGSWVRMFCWSPDGKQLFMSVGEGSKFATTVISLGGSVITTFPDSAGSWGIPVWSPDGRWIAVGQGRSKNYPKGRILLLSPDGKSARSLEPPLRPSQWRFCMMWSRDSRTLYIGGDAGPEGAVLYSMDARTGSSRKIGAYGLDVWFGLEMSATSTASLSKDGKSIIVTAGTEQSSIYILDGAL